MKRKNRPFTNDEEEFLRANCATMTLTELSKALANRNRGGLYHKLESMGLRAKLKHPRLDMKAILQWRFEGRTWAECAILSGRTESHRGSIYSNFEKWAKGRYPEVFKKKLREKLLAQPKSDDLILSPEYFKRFEKMLEDRERRSSR